MKKAKILCAALGIMIFSSFSVSAKTMNSGTNSTAYQNVQGANQSQFSKFEFECRNSRSVPIRGTVELPQGIGNKKVPVVIMSHGIFGNRDSGGDFVKLASSLNSRGFATVRFDFDGNGRSGGSLIDNSIKTEMDDLSAVINYVKTLSFVDSSKINLFGFSMGGAVTSVVAGDRSREIKSVCLWAPAAVLVDNCEKGILFDAKVDIHNIPDRIPVLGGRVMYGKAFFKDAIGFDLYGRAAKCNKDILILHGDNDYVVPLSYAQKYTKVCPHATLNIIRGGGHGNSGKLLDDTINMTTNYFVQENR
ncbi:alpha/beta fold hydrolase [Clostridium sp. HBUAS56017]|uniref:alpha/beta hydrolase family protein n=1 Tax=Clostridium sp. HBUAS56017 TaxID=2571128 RepID=UPI001177A7F4|nr:alpha/beta fold hydrolase [Clostridium sp. HBUAS56017]